MKKKFLSILTGAVIAMNAIAPVSVAAEEIPISVYVDNEKINFETTQPIIMNDRTMVPVRETAEKLGFDVNWDPTQSTFGLISHDLFVTHKLNSNAVTVRGEQLVFDTTSVVMDDYSLLPIVMLQMALDASISWDEATRSVRISTDPTSSGSDESNNSYENSYDYDDPNYLKPLVLTTFDNTVTTRQNQDNSIVVIASDYADSVRMVSSNGDVVAESSDYKDNYAGREFELVFIPRYATIMETRYTIQAAVNNAYNVSGETPIFIKTTPGISIESATASASKVSVGSTVEFYVTGNEGVTRVKIEDESGDTIATSNTPLGGISDITPDFKLSYELEKSGEQTFKVYVGDDDGYNSDYELVELTVEDLTDLEIIDVEIDDFTIEIDDDIEIEIVTSAACGYVAIYDTSDRKLGDTTTYKTLTNGNRVFTVYGEPIKEGNYTIYVRAFLDKYEDDFLEEELSISVGEYYWNYSLDSYDVGKVYAHYCSPTTISKGVRTYINFEFVTSDDARYIDIYNEYGDLLTTLYDYDYEKNGKFYWEEEIRVTLYNTYDELTYKVYYYGGEAAKTGTVGLSVI